MIINIVTSQGQAEFLQSHKWVSFKTKVISVEPHPTEVGFYNVSIEFPIHYDASLIAQIIFGAGISYGLDLKYASYDNEPSRMR